MGLVDEDMLAIERDDMLAMAMMKIVWASHDINTLEHGQDKCGRLELIQYVATH